ncbi:TonB-dependent receptor [Flaviaesturariibacter amylovorans]|uniref:TonB-dependent receptor n=1 Tax=Flaviaesturariibacter amylovorans TaxID=1084520 RepID=A0ABP8GFN8_9BACT
MRLFYLLLLLCTQSAVAQTARVGGTVRDAATNSPLPFATIRVEQGGRQLAADSTGAFLFSDLAPGTYAFTATVTGYEPLTQFNIPVTTGNTGELVFRLAPAAGTLTEVRVGGSRRSVRATTLETPLSVQRLSTEEIKSSPGSNFDISRAVQSLPGISGSDGLGVGYRNDLIIRGGAPYESVYYLDGIEIPVINHFATQGAGGGPQGILNVSFIEDVRVSTSAFDARYDNALSGVFAFRQKNGNRNRVQGNIRLSASELAATFDGPLSKKRDLTFLASARRSYLQLLFAALDLPIRPEYYDFQTKLNYRPDAKNEFTLIGIGAIDQFKFGRIRKPTLEKYTILEGVPANNQWNYTIGGRWQRSFTRGLLTAALSSNSFDIDLVKYDGNAERAENLRFRTASRESEQKLRVELTQNYGDWRLSLGVNGQHTDYRNSSYIRRRPEVRDPNGNVVQAADIFAYDTDLQFLRYGSFVQAGRTLLDGRLSLSGGLRFDGNGLNRRTAFSPRASLRYAFTPAWSFNATTGSYARLAPYTVLGFREAGTFVNRDIDYIYSDHYVAGIEFVPSSNRRFTLEAFRKGYRNVPVSLRNGISLNNLGADFTAFGNEPVAGTGKGEAYGFEFFAQQKLTKRFFGFASYTYVLSRFSGTDGVLRPSAWDNRHLASFTLGYKLPRNWELGLKYRYQGGLPFTPFDEAASRLNYARTGSGILDYSRFNENRLRSFQQSDLRVDKKWNFRKATLDLFIDIQNWTAFKAPLTPQYTFDRDLTTGSFLTTDGAALRADGANAIPRVLTEDTSVPLPTIGFILEF